MCAAGGHLVETRKRRTYDLSTANGRKRLRDDANAAIYEVDHNLSGCSPARAEVAAEGRWLGGKRPFGWELERNPVDGDGKPMLDEDGKPVRGIMRLVQAEADPLAQAHRDVLDGATLGSICRDWNDARHPHDDREAVARRGTGAGAEAAEERRADGVSRADLRGRAMASHRG